MQHKIFTTIVVSFFALVCIKAQVEVNESNFSSHIIAALKADWSSVAGDGTLTSEDIATITNLSLTGKGAGDELSLKGVEILTAVETLSLNNLKFGGDFSILPEGTSSLECHGCVIDKFEIYADLVSLIISDKTTFNDILLSGSQGHRIENIELRNLDIEDFDPTLKSDYRLEGYLKIIDCPKIKHANLRIASSLNMNGVPELADMDWGTMYTKFGESSTNIIELSKALGIVTDEDIYVNKRYGFKSNVTLTLPDKSTPIFLDDYNLSASRVSSISGPMAKDEEKNTLVIDWEVAGADEASVTYRYNCLKGASKKYLEVELTVKVGAEPEDEEAPVIKVGEDELGATASYEESVTLTITDNKGVASVTINGESVSEPYVIPAEDGTYKVVAKDEKGNTATTTITIKMPVVEPEDEEAPVIKVGGVELGATANYEESVTLTITDNKGVASVTINDVPASEPYVIPAEDGTYKVVAKDEKGNTATTTITIKMPVVEPEDEEAPVIKVGDEVLGATANYEESVTLTITDNKGVASVTINGESVSEPYVIPAVDGTYKVVAKDGKGNTATTTITIKLPVVEPEDEEAPVIKVGGVELGATANYEESVTLTITDNKGVASVTINGKPASEPYVIPAEDGTYKVVAKDEKGNTATTTITIKLPVVEPEDEEAPVIKVGGVVLGTTANYEESVTMTITDNKGVVSVTINGEPASEPYIIPAKDGVYVVVAKDEKGNTTAVTITIKLPVIIEPEPGEVMIIESSGVQTTVFRTIKTDDFSGIEVLAKEKMRVEVYNESGKSVKLVAFKMNNGATRIAMPVGKYKINMGQFKNVDIEIK